jgi:flagellar biosynthesis/type III secretory pathway protein FliH
MPRKWSQEEMDAESDRLIRRWNKEEPLEASLIENDALEEEVGKLQDELQQAEMDYETAYEEGYEKGYDDGYERGYEACELQRWQDWRDNYEDLARQLSNAGFSLKIAIEQRQSATIHSVVSEIDTIADDIVDAVALLPKEPDG